MTRAVVFAYHNVGVRCLKVLLAQGHDVALVLTHEDHPSEHIWFDNVGAVAADYGIPVLTPENPNIPEIVQSINELAPDFLFSFYYRRMLSPRTADDRAVRRVQSTWFIATEISWPSAGQLGNSAWRDRDWGHFALYDRQAGCRRYCWPDGCANFAR